MGVLNVCLLFYSAALFIRPWIFPYNKRSLLDHKQHNTADIKLSGHRFPDNIFEFALSIIGVWSETGSFLCVVCLMAKCKGQM